jgi:hypothetical protein
MLNKLKENVGFYLPFLFFISIIILVSRLIFLSNLTLTTYYYPIFFGLVIINIFFLEKSFYELGIVFALVAFIFSIMTARAYGGPEAIIVPLSAIFYFLVFSFWWKFLEERKNRIFLVYVSNFVFLFLIVFVYLGVPILTSKKAEVINYVKKYGGIESTYLPFWAIKGESYITFSTLQKEYWCPRAILNWKIIPRLTISKTLIAKSTENLKEVNDIFQKFQSESTNLVKIPDLKGGLLVSKKSSNLFKTIFFEKNGFQFEIDSGICLISDDELLKIAHSVK